MPLYSFFCDTCDHTAEEFRPYEQYKDPMVCTCGADMLIDIGAAAPRVYGKRFYEKPLHSDSLAISKSQVAEHRMRWPHIEIDSEFRPVFTNARDHDKYLRETGFVKMKQKVRHVPVQRLRAKTVDGKVTLVEIT